jgi:succinyl-CoA synthetase beta subunit
MRLYEYEAAEIFESKGIPVPRRAVAGSPEEALNMAAEIGYPVVLKAQVLTGGRGLAGGVQTAAGPEELEKTANDLLNMEINNLPVRRIMVGEKAEIASELYAGVTIDGFSGTPVMVAGTRGGVNIEETARISPQEIAAVSIDPQVGFYPYQARTLLRKLGLSGRLLISCADVLVRLYRVFNRFEALTAEINPLVVLPNEGLLAVDAKLELDDSALTRIKYSVPDYLGRGENPLERRGREIGVTYVDLDGDIGLISSGAGLGMDTMDIIGERLRPANFLETGGGITEKLLYKCMELVMMKEGLRAILINIYGGINPIQEGAKGVVRYIREHKVKIPVVAKALGNYQEETWEILRSGGVQVVEEPASEVAVKRLLELLEEAQAETPEPRKPI